MLWLVLCSLSAYSYVPVYTRFYFFLMILLFSGANKVSISDKCYAGPKVNKWNFISHRVEYWMPVQGQESHGKRRSKMQEIKADLATQQCYCSSSVVPWILNKGDKFFSTLKRKTVYLTAQHSSTDKYFFGCFKYRHSNLFSKVKKSEDSPLKTIRTSLLKGFVKNLVPLHAQRC